MAPNPLLCSLDVQPQRLLMHQRYGSTAAGHARLALGRVALPMLKAGRDRPDLIAAAKPRLCANPRPPDDLHLQSSVCIGSDPLGWHLWHRMLTVGQQTVVLGASWCCTQLLAATCWLLAAATTAQALSAASPSQCCSLQVRAQAEQHPAFEVWSSTTSRMSGASWPWSACKLD